MKQKKQEKIRSERNKLRYFIMVSLTFVLMLSLSFIVNIVNASYLHEEQRNLRISLVVFGIDAIYESYGGEVFPIGFMGHNVSFSSVRVGMGDTRGVLNQGAFTAKLYFSNHTLETNFTPDFLLLTNPPTFLNVTSVNLNFPYYEDIERLEVYYLGNLTLSFDFIDYFCNFDGVCQNEYTGFLGMSETYLSCSSDCEVNATDGICMTAPGKDFYWADGLCDLDCYEDEDCEESIFILEESQEIIEDKDGFLHIVLIVKDWFNENISLNNLKKEVINWLN
jgi:hypothetical protein